MKITRKKLHAQILELQRRLDEIQTKPEAAPASEGTVSHDARRALGRELKTVQLNLKVTPGFKERFLELAAAQRMSMTDYLEWLVDKHTGQGATRVHEPFSANNVRARSGSRCPSHFVGRTAAIAAA
jgi:hypothetical protein